MRALKRIVLGVAAGLVATPLAASAAPAQAAAVQGERALREECSANSQADMRGCLAGKADDSQKALKQAEDAALGTLAKWDEDAKYVNAAKAALGAANKAFARQREAQCAFAASLGGGGAGNAREMLRLACVAELNNRRAEQLRDAVSSLPLK